MSNKAVEHAKSLGYSDAEYKGKWKQYDVFEPKTKESLVADVGKPKFIFAVGDSVFLAPEDEVFEYIDNLEDDDVEKSSGSDYIVEVNKSDLHDFIVEVNKSDQFDHIVEVEKYNPYHDARGRFTSANSAASFTFKPGSAANARAITREKERYAATKENVDANIAKVRAACGNDAKPISKEAVNMAKVKDRGGCSDEDAKKCVELADGIFSRAQAVEPKITEDIVSNVAKNGGQMYGLAHRMKQTTSMAGKIAADSKEGGVSYEKAAAGIKDAIRYTAVFESEGFTAGYNNVKSTLEAQGYKEIRCKNFFDMYENGKTCQKAVQCVYENPNGQRFELQFHTYGTQGAKEVNHPYYEDQRKAGTSQKQKDHLEDLMTRISANAETPSGALGIPSHDGTR